MVHSARAIQNMTNQLKAQLGFLQKDLVHEKASMKKAKSYLKYNLPGIKTMVSRHQAGVNKTLKDLADLKKRIRKRQANGECYKIL